MFKESLCKNVARVRIAGSADTRVNTPWLVYTVLCWRHSVNFPLCMCLTLGVCLPSACWLQSAHREVKGMRRRAAALGVAAHKNMEHWKGECVRDPELAWAILLSCLLCSYPCFCSFIVRALPLGRSLGPFRRDPLRCRPDGREHVLDAGMRPTRQRAAQSLASGSAQLHGFANRVQLFQAPLQLHRGTPEFIHRIWWRTPFGLSIVS